MFPSANFVLLVTLAATAALSLAFQRDVSFVVNPGCDPSLCNDSAVNDSVNLVHVKADGPRDTIHALWSTVGAPSVLVARTANSVNVSVDWKKFLHPGDISDDDAVIHFTSNPVVVFGFVLRSLVEYDDKDDVANPDYYTNHSTETREYPLDDASRRWAPVSMLDDTFVFRTSPADEDLSTTLTLRVRVTGSTTRGSALPRLQLTPNNTHCDVFLIDKPSLFEHSRFYLVADVINRDYPMKLSVRTNLDDEYTPGVFRSFRLGAVATKNADDGRYALWKPVAYTTAARSLEAATKVKAYDDGPVKRVKSVKSVVDGYFPKFQPDYSRQIKISIGLEDDKFYKKTNFAVFSFLVGIGLPPEDEISTLVIVVISIGLGIPAIFIVAGGVYAGVKERKKKAAVVPTSNVITPLLEEHEETMDAPNSNYGAINS